MAKAKESNDTMKWGRETAKERYGSPKVDSRLMSQKSEEAPQSPEDKRVEPEYSNIASGWVRGAASGKPTMFNETGETKPSFDKSKAGR